jgi:hypothetical protein
VEHSTEVEFVPSIMGVRGRELGGPPLVHPSPSRRAPGAARNSQGNPVEPTPYRVLFAYGARTANEDEERSLEGILCGVLIAQDRPANAEHHRAMALD